VLSLEANSTSVEAARDRLHAMRDTVQARTHLARPNTDPPHVLSLEANSTSVEAARDRLHAMRDTVQARTHLARPNTDPPRSSTA
jgi:hypothetical protein